MSRSRRSRQEVRVAIGAWLRLKDFKSQKKIVVSQQDFMEWCRDRVWPRPKDLCRDRAWPWARNFMSRQSIYVAISFDQDKRVSCREKVFCVATRCGQDKGALC